MRVTTCYLLSTVTLHTSLAHTFDFKRKMVTAVLSTVMLISCLVGGVNCTHVPTAEESVVTEIPDTLPENFRRELARFSFINKATSQVLKEFKVLGGTIGTYVPGGPVCDTYVVGFEDRYSGAEADLEFLDVIVEMKQTKGSDTMTVRIVQLGLDTIDVYLDGTFLGSIRPAIEIQIDCRTE